MRKIARTIAVVLILLMLASSFTSCLSYWGKGHSTGKRVLYAVVDIITLPISLLALLIYVIISEEAGDTQGYFANLDKNALSEYYSLYWKFGSLSEAEFDSLMKTLSLISEEEKQLIINKFSALSGADLTALAAAYKSLSKDDYVSSIERINSLSEAEVSSLLQSFNSLTDTELNSIIDTINSQTETVNITFAGNELQGISYDAIEEKSFTLAKY